jgi:hypothetical protein
MPADLPFPKWKKHKEVAHSAIGILRAKNQGLSMRSGFTRPQKLAYQEGRKIK